MEMKPGSDRLPNPEALLLCLDERLTSPLTTDRATFSRRRTNVGERPGLFGTLSFRLGVCVCIAQW